MKSSFDIFPARIMLLLLLAPLVTGCGISASVTVSKSTAPAVERDGSAVQRIYRPDSRWRYKMVRDYFENGKFKRKEVVLSDHTVDASHPQWERIMLVAMTKTQDGKSENLDEAIGKFPAYKASLILKDDPQALALPDIAGWDMSIVGPVTDLHTFLVAVSPQVGIHNLSKAGDAHTLPEAPVASWANGDLIPVGQDCIQISITLTELNKEAAVYETRFMPPAESGLEMLRPWMEEQVVKGTPNNFQQQMKMGDGAGVMWGAEQFTVVSKVRRLDGMLLEATMDNRLTLQMKIGCDPKLDKCQHQLPMNIHRKLKLQLVEEN